MWVKWHKTSPHPLRLSPHLQMSSYQTCHCQRWQLLLPQPHLQLQSRSCRGLHPPQASAMQISNECKQYITTQRTSTEITPRLKSIDASRTQWRYWKDLTFLETSGCQPNGKFRYLMQFAFPNFCTIWKRCSQQKPRQVRYFPIETSQ